MESQMLSLCGKTVAVHIPGTADRFSGVVDAEDANWLVLSGVARDSFGEHTVEPGQHFFSRAHVARVVVLKPDAQNEGTTGAKA